MVYIIWNFAIVESLDILEGFWIPRHLPPGHWRCQSATYRIENKEWLERLSLKFKEKAASSSDYHLRGQLGFRAEAVSRGTVACTIETGLQHFPYLLFLRTLSMVVGSGRK